MSYNLVEFYLLIIKLFITKLLASLIDFEQVTVKKKVVFKNLARMKLRKSKSSLSCFLFFREKQKSIRKWFSRLIRWWRKVLA